MIRQPATPSDNLRRHARQIRASILAVMLASLPALAADQADSNQAAAANDPFGVYEAQLSDAASVILQRVVQPDLLTRVARDPQANDPTLISAAPRNNEGAFARVEQLRPLLEAVLRQAGLPAELAAVVLVESGGNPAALSPKGARGLWQLMPDTARRYGLTVDGERDERLDLLKSTRAAAEYLRDLYAQFQSWPLALAAYNAGESAVERALTRTGTGTFSVAARALPLETQNYVPAVLRALPRFSAAPPFRIKRQLNVVYAAPASRSRLRDKTQTAAILAEAQ
jgi:soluble lytic murein transglycosylase-like protein